MALSAEKQAALDKSMAETNKKFGKGTINLMSNILDKLKIKYYKTPSFEVNLMLNGGVGVGKVIEFFGESGSGKTSLALETIAYNQKKDSDFMAGWFETEGSYDPDYAKNVFGIDHKRCTYWDQKDYGAETGLDILRGLVSSGVYNMIVINSVAGLTPKKEIVDNIEDQNVALTARMMSKLMRVIVGMADNSGTTLIFINQMRTNIGVKYGGVA